MFGWFGEVGGTRKIHTHRCVEFLLFGRQKSQENHQNHFSSLFTLVVRHRFFFFVPETLNPIFLGKSKKTRAGK